MAEAVRRRRDAIAGALLGAMVADALAMPTHWFYGGARQVLAEYGSAIKGYVQPNKRLAGSIMNKSSTGGGGRGDASGDVIGSVICHGKKPFWAPNESNHYHCTLKAGENTLEAQLCRLLARTITKDKGTFHASSFREAYANFMTTPGSHNDCYCSTCHRMFFANMKRGLPLEQCPDNDGHNVDTIDGLSLPTVVSLASARKSRTDSDRDVTECVRVTRNSPSLEAAAIAWNGAVRAVVNDNRSTKEASLPSAFGMAAAFDDEFEKGVLANANAGGENVHRGIVVGALLGARAGRSALPPNLVNGLAAADEIVREVDEFVQAISSA